MLGWVVFFLVLALLAALFGFGGLAGAAAGIAQILFFVFILLSRRGLHIWPTHGSLTPLA